MPKKMITKPAILEKTEIFEEINEPSQVAVAPSRINTTEKPAIKKTELNKTARLSLLSQVVFSALSPSSAKETPDMNETYPGTNGSTQGDRNEINPAANAIYIETSGMFSNSALFQTYYNLLICEHSTVHEGRKPGTSEP
jgi:hypothetical protein